MGDFPNGDFGPQFTYQNSPFTQDFVRAANRHWLEDYHVDGFRYDNVKGFYSGPTGPDYANVVYQTYQDSAGIRDFKIRRAFGGSFRWPSISMPTRRPSSWTHSRMRRGKTTSSNQAADMARNGYVNDNFAHLLDPSFMGYPRSRDFGGVAGPVAPFQYLETHDHSDFISNFGHDRRGE